VNIVSWIDRRGGRSGAASDSGLRHGTAFKRVFGRAKADRAIANTDGTDTDVAKFLFHFIECHRCRRQGKIAPAAGEFAEAIAALAWPGRVTDFRADLFWVQGGDERATQEVRRGHHARPSAPPG